MRPFIAKFTFVLVFALSGSALGDAVEKECIDKATTIETKFSCIKGLTFAETTPVNVAFSVRQFEMTYEQPVDHANLTAGTFKQRLVLLHRGESEPMVLQTSGYLIFNIAQSVLAKYFLSNQIQVEHRFFANSKPDAMDWSKLNVKQSADDFHRITQAFRQIYPAKWVNTGASKGGMTSVFHRRFYPNDLDGTVADVAPLSFGTEDARYVDFVRNVGGDTYADCREKLKTIQVRLLENRLPIVSELTGPFTQLGGADTAFEHAVIEMSFAFWQYHQPTDPEIGCDRIPYDSNIETMAAYLKKVNDVTGLGDEDLFKFMPYYFQAATQLGNPASDLEHLNPLRLYDYSIDQYTPKGVSYSYSQDQMLDVKNWVEKESEKILFVYGELDPWSSGMYPYRAEADSHRFIVDGGNHRSNVSLLAEPKKKEALAVLARWFGKEPAELDNLGVTLDELDHQVRRKYHLP